MCYHVQYFNFVTFNTETAIWVWKHLRYAIASRQNLLQTFSLITLRFHLPWIQSYQKHHQVPFFSLTDFPTCQYNLQITASFAKLWITNEEILMYELFSAFVPQGAFQNKNFLVLIHNTIIMLEKTNGYRQ